MTDTPETLQSALADLTRRVAAFEKAQKAEEEPPVCSEALLGFLERGCESLGGSDYKKAAAEIRHLRSELARLREENAALREGQKWQPDDLSDGWVSSTLAHPNRFYGMCIEVNLMLKEIARRRGLTLDGAK